MYAQNASYDNYDVSLSHEHHKHDSLEYEHEGSLAQPEGATDTEHELPPGWIQYMSEEGWPYYFNEILNQSSWERPTVDNNNQWAMSAINAAADEEGGGSFIYTEQLDVTSMYVSETSSQIDISDQQASLSYSPMAAEERFFQPPSNLGCSSFGFEDKDSRRIDISEITLNMKAIMESRALDSFGLAPYSASSAVSAVEFFSPLSPPEDAVAPQQQEQSPVDSSTMVADISSSSRMVSDIGSGSAHSLEVAASLLLSPTSPSLLLLEEDGHSEVAGNGAGNNEFLLEAQSWSVGSSSQAELLQEQEHSSASDLQMLDMPRCGLDRGVQELEPNQYQQEQAEEAHEQGGLLDLSECGTAEPRFSFPGEKHLPQGAPAEAPLTALYPPPPAHMLVLPEDDAPSQPLPRLHHPGAAALSMYELLPPTAVSGESELFQCLSSSSADVEGGATVLSATTASLQSLLGRAAVAASHAQMQQSVEERLHSSSVNYEAPAQCENPDTVSVERRGQDERTPSSGGSSSPLDYSPYLGGGGASSDEYSPAAAPAAIFYSRPSEVDVAALISDDSDQDDAGVARTEPAQEAYDYWGSTGEGVDTQAYGGYNYDDYTDGQREYTEAYQSEEGFQASETGAYASQTQQEEGSSSAAYPYEYDTAYDYPAAAHQDGTGDWAESTHASAGQQGWAENTHTSTGQQGWAENTHALAGQQGWAESTHTSAGQQGWAESTHSLTGQQDWTGAAGASDDWADQADYSQQYPAEDEQAPVAELDSHEVAWLQYERLRDGGAISHEEVDASGGEYDYYAQSLVQGRSLTSSGSSKYGKLKASLSKPRAGGSKGREAPAVYREEEFYETQSESPAVPEADRQDAHWVECYTAQGDVYYYNPVTQHVQWESPYEASGQGAGNHSDSPAAADYQHNAAQEGVSGPDRTSVEQWGASADSQQYEAAFSASQSFVDRQAGSAQHRWPSSDSQLSPAPVPWGAGSTTLAVRPAVSPVSLPVPQLQPPVYPREVDNSSPLEAEEEEERTGSRGEDESTMGSPMAYNRYTPLGIRSSTRSISSLSDNDNSEYGFGSSVQGSVQGAFVVSQQAGVTGRIPLRSPTHSSSGFVSSPGQSDTPHSANRGGGVWGDASPLSAPVTSPIVGIDTDAASHTSQASSESQTHRHLEIWDRFFRNALMVSQNRDGHADETNLSRNAVKESIRKIRQRAAASRSKGATAVARWPHTLTQRRYDALIRFALRKGGATEDTELSAGDVAGLSEDEKALIESSSVVGSVSSIDGTLLSMALLAAALHEDLASAEVLLRSGANPSCVDDQLRTPAHYACRTGQVALLALLFDHDAELEALDAAGRSPLHTAAIFSRTACMEFLLGCAVDCNAGDLAGNSPLHLVARAGFEEGCRLLLRFGASTSARNLMGMTALSVAQVMRPQTPALQTVVQLLTNAAAGMPVESPMHLSASVSVDNNASLVSESASVRSSRQPQHQQHSPPPVVSIHASQDEQDEGDRSFDEHAEGEESEEEEEGNSVADIVASSVWGVASTLIDITLSMFSPPAVSAPICSPAASPAQPSRKGGSWSLFSSASSRASSDKIAEQDATPALVGQSGGPPTDQELLDRGLGFPVSRSATQLSSPPSAGSDLGALAYRPPPIHTVAPPSLVARDLGKQMQALRSSSAQSTPSRDGSVGRAPPTPPSEVMVAVALNKVEQQRQQSLLRAQHQRPVAALSLMEERDATSPRTVPSPLQLNRGVSDASGRFMNPAVEPRAESPHSLSPVGSPTGATSPPTSSNSYSLGAALPRGVTWRYVDVLNNEK